MCAEPYGLVVKVSEAPEARTCEAILRPGLLHFPQPQQQQQQQQQQGAGAVPWESEANDVDPTQPQPSRGSAGQGQEQDEATNFGYSVCVAPLYLMNGEWNAGDWSPAVSGPDGAGGCTIL